MTKLTPTKPNKPKPSRGGYRAGARRPTIYDAPLNKRTFRIATKHDEVLSLVDPKNPSAAFRKILDDPGVQAAIDILIWKEKGKKVKS